MMHLKKSITGNRCKVLETLEIVYLQPNLEIYTVLIRNKLYNNPFLAMHVVIICCDLTLKLF